MIRFYALVWMLMLMIVPLYGCTSDEPAQINSFDECVAAGNPIQESYPRKCTAQGNTFVEELPAAEEMSEELCNSAGGHWNSCSSKCRIDNQGKDGVACAMMCEPLCECGGIKGYSCPEGYECRAPSGVADALGYCAAR